MAKYFTIEELCASSKAKKLKIDNTPTEEIKKNLEELMEVLDDIREKWGSAIRVNSGYRCEKLNVAVGGSKTSMHKKGFAADLYPINDDFEGFVKFIKDWGKKGSYDQIIRETDGKNDWIHLGLKNNSGIQRKLILSLKKK